MAALKRSRSVDAELNPTGLFAARIEPRIKLTAVVRRYLDELGDERVIRPAGRERRRPGFRGRS